MIVADSDVLIDFVGGREPAAGRIAAELKAGDMHTTAVTRFEILSGARSAAQLESLHRLLKPIKVLSLDASSADRAAAVRRALEHDGSTIGMGDCLVAGIALGAGGMLLTRNRRHFARVGGLKLAPL